MFYAELHLEAMFTDNEKILMLYSSKGSNSRNVLFSDTSKDFIVTDMVITNKDTTRNNKKTKKRRENIK